MSLFKRSPRFEILKIRKLADTTGERVVRFDPTTGEKKLVNPHSPGDVHEPWPLAGVRFEGDPPNYTSVSQSFAVNGQSEGWLVLVNARQVTRPGGPPDFKEKPDQAHNFLHADQLIFKTVDGDVTYNVIRQPDKYHEKNDELAVSDEAYAAGRTKVDWFYQLERVV